MKIEVIEEPLFNIIHDNISIEQYDTDFETDCFDVSKKILTEMFAFTEWVGSNEWFYDIENKRWVVDTGDDGEVQSKTTEEIYLYWVNYIKK